MNNNYSLLPKQKKDQAVIAIINYFATERDEQIGIIAAEDLLDMFLEEIGPYIFNAGLDEALTILKRKHEETSFDLQVLKKE